MQAFRDWAQFIATVISPVLLAWVGWVGTQIQSHQEKALARQDQLQREAIARQDQLQKEAFAASGTRFEHTKNLFGDLLSAKIDQKRLAVLSTLAFVHEGQIPEFFLPVLAITESKDADIATYLRQGLTELTLAENAPSSMRTEATRALSLLVSPNDIGKGQNGQPSDDVLRANVQAVTDVAANLVKESAAANKPEEKKQAEKQLQQLAPTLAALAVSGPNSPTKAQATSTLEKTAVDRPSVEQAVANVASNLPIEAQSTITPRVYFQVQDEKQLFKAEELKQELIKDGNIVPRIENVRETNGVNSDKVEVRYFDQDAKPYAEKILNLLKAKGVKGETIFVTPPSSDQLGNSLNAKTKFEVVAGKNSF
jgi:hypothetical protein